MPASPLIPVLGLMAGTSMDGIDAAIIRTDGERVEATGIACTLPYKKETRAMIMEAVREAAGDTAASTQYAALPARHAALARRITTEHAEAARMVIEKAGEAMPHLIGFHGQTILHAPGQGISIQLGDAALLADRLALPVVHDFRRADIEAGGEGAPLAPIYHRALMEAFGLTPPCAIVNIGGIANISYWDGETLHGFDCGPGNAAMDREMMEATKGRAHFDKDGALAAQGKVDEAWLERAMAHDYFRRPAPKSLDRAEALAMTESHPLPPGLSPACRMASLAALTAHAIATHLSVGIKHVVLSGGGARNTALTDMLRARLPCAATLTTMAEHGRDGDMTEAEMMGFLAMRSARNLPITFPATTGAPAPLCGGVQISPSDPAT